jgi:hypothetical protein
MTDPQQQALPPLPEPASTIMGLQVTGTDDIALVRGVRLFTEHQMRAYAAAAVARALAASAPQLVERWAGDDKIESPFNACQHKGYCLSLKAASAPSREATIQPGLMVPDGWKLVPIEPTEEMCAAAVKLANGDAVYKNVALAALKVEESIYGEAYAAMLAAAPSTPVAAEDPDDAATMERMADLLTRTANALRGDPGPLRRWSWHDLPERAAAVAARGADHG